MILLSFACFSQSKADKDFEKARNYFIEGKDDRAEELLQKINNSNSNIVIKKNNNQYFAIRLLFYRLIYRYLD